MKKLISLLLALIMACAVTVTGFAAPKSADSPQETYSMIWHQALNDTGDFGVMSGFDRTVFLDLKAGADGSALRFQFDNIDDRQSDIRAMTVFVNNICYPVTLNGSKRIVVPAGKKLESDPVNVKVKRGDPIQLRIFYHNIRVGNGTATEDGYYTKKGNQTETNYNNGVPLSSVEKKMSTLATIPLLSAIEIKGQPVQSIVIFGDSIVAMHRWTDPLQERVSNYFNGKYVVLNSGLSGNCLVYPPDWPMNHFFGEPGVKRFQRDALDLTNVHTVMLSLGVNDLSYMTVDTKDKVSVEKLIAATTDLVKQLRARGIRVVAQTITPRMGYSSMGKSFTEQQEQYRQQYNTWLRNCGLFDYLVDFDECVRDPQNPAYFREDLHQGDHLHPNAEGGKLMADYVDLNKLV